MYYNSRQVPLLINIYLIIINQKQLYSCVQGYSETNDHVMILNFLCYYGMWRYSAILSKVKFGTMWLPNHLTLTDELFLIVLLTCLSWIINYKKTFSHTDFPFLGPGINWGLVKPSYWKSLEQEYSDTLQCEVVNITMEIMEYHVLLQQITVTVMWPSMWKWGINEKLTSYSRSQNQQNGFTVENSLNSFFKKLTSSKIQRHIGKHVDILLWSWRHCGMWV